MTKEQLIKIYSAYLPYRVNFRDSDGIWKENRILTIHSFNWLLEFAKPILYSMDMLTKEELFNAGFEDHVDWLTNEIELWIKKYGIESYLNQTPHGHIKYSLSQHYNIFNLPET
ncbi:MAG: hypothetical protein ACRC8Z_10765 [Empedobacter falsenii]